MKVCTYKSKELPMPDSFDINSALYWIAARIPPTDYPYFGFIKEDLEKVSQDSLSKAAEDLCYQLIKGNLTAKGEPFGKPREIHHKREEKDIDSLISIPSEDWWPGLFDWQNGTLSSFDHDEAEWRFIELFAEDVLKIWPPSECARSVVLDSYNPPFIQLMQEAISHFKISEENQVMTKILIPWFEEELIKMGEKYPNNKAKMMTTFVRSFDSQKGGNKKKTKPANLS
jgi:hypothetical protein